MGGLGGTRPSPKSTQPTWQQIWERFRPYNCTFPVEAGGKASLSLSPVDQVENGGNKPPSLGEGGHGVRHESKQAK